jgi:iron complex outermembrane receptor protein
LAAELADFPLLNLLPTKWYAANITWVLLSVPVAAATQPAPSPGAEFDEVVVTARRTEEPLQNTPVAVTALTMDQLEARSVKDLRDIGRFTPNVYMSITGVQSPDTISMFIRGVGLSDLIATTDPGVGLYVDGVYYARAQGAVLDFVDVERIEVLRGPQGTLFGKNTAGGAINVISNPPDPNGGGVLSLTAGNLGQLQARGYGSMPLSDNLTLGLSGLGKRRDCLSRRMYDDACIGGINRISGRGYLRWTPGSDVTVDLIADTTAGRSNMVPNHPEGFDPNQSFWGTYNDLVAAGQIPGGIPFTHTNPGVYPGRYEVSGRAPNEAPLDANGVSLGVEYRVGDTTLHSISAYRDVSSLAFESGGGGTGAIYDAESVFSYTKSHWFSQELRVDGKAFGDRLDYVGGLYYFGETGVTNVALPFFPPLQAGWVNFNTQETDSYSAFVHASYSISDRLRASAGIRYTRETKNWSAKYARFATFASAEFDPNARTLELVRGNGAGIPNELISSEIGAGPLSTAPLRRRDTWTLITPKFGVDFQATPDLLLFANVARGSRAGGFNGRAAASVATVPFDPEYALSYEIGEKAELLDRRLRINTTVFYTDYKDLQQSVLVCVRLPNGECQIGEGGLVFAPVVANAASARIYGGELELVALGSKGLRLEAALGYTDAKFASVDSIATQTAGLTTDSVVPFVPSWTGAFAAQYSLDLGHGSLTPRVDYTWRGKMAFNVNPGPYGAQGSFGLVNATLAYNDSDDRWSAQLYVRNLADKDYALLLHEFSHVVGGPGGMVTEADPREYGLTVTRKF